MLSKGKLLRGSLVIGFVLLCKRTLSDFLEFWSAQIWGNGELVRGLWYFDAQVFNEMLSDLSYLYYILGAKYYRSS